MSFCEECGHDLPPDAVHCDACGARVVAAARADRRAIPGRIIFAVVGGAVLAMFVTLGGQALIGDGDASEPETAFDARNGVHATEPATAPVRPPTRTPASEGVFVTVQPPRPGDTPEPRIASPTPAGTDPTIVPATATPEPVATTTVPPAPTESPPLPPTPTEAVPATGFQGSLLITSALGEPVGFFVDGTTLAPDPAPISQFVDSGSYEQQVRSLGQELDPACDYAFISFDGSGSYDPATGAIEGWFILTLELVSDGSGECGYLYVPATVTFNGTIDTSGNGSGQMTNESLSGAYPWTSIGTPRLAN